MYIKERVACVVGIPLPVLVVVPVARRLRCLLAVLSGAPRLLLVGTRHALRLSVNFW
jgi:hypothetical protein